MSRHNNPNIHIMNAPISITSGMIERLQGKALKAYENDPEMKNAIEMMILSKSLDFSKAVSTELNQMFK